MSFLPIIMSLASDTVLGVEKCVNNIKKNETQIICGLELKFLTRVISKYLIYISGFEIDNYAIMSLEFTVCPWLIIEHY